MWLIKAYTHDEDHFTNIRQGAAYTHELSTGRVSILQWTQNHPLVEVLIV